jgi:hypothetical protein
MTDTKKYFFTVAVLCLFGCVRPSQNLLKGDERAEGADDKVRSYDAPQKLLQPFVLGQSAVKADSNARLVHIYVANDSREATMQLAVQYDLEQLQKSCEQGKNVNWIAFISSHLIYARSKDGSGIRTSPVPACIDGKKITLANFETLPPPATAPDFPFLTRGNLAAAIQFARKSFEQSGQTGVVNYFVSLKSHGGLGQPLLGFSYTQMRSKIEWSKSRLGDDLSNAVKYGDVGWKRGDKGQLEEIRLPVELITKAKDYGLGHVDDKVVAYVDSILRPKVEETPKESSATTAEQKNVDEGLKNAALGVNDLWDQFDAAFNEQSKAKVLGVYFDSCSPSPLTNDQGRMTQTSNLDYVGSIYYAKGSMWYRTINWDDIYQRLANVESGIYAQKFYEEFGSAAQNAVAWPVK